MENNCTKTTTFWFNLPRKMRKLCVLRALSKSTILKKNLESMISKKKNFLESMILNKKIFVKKMILNEKIFVLSDFESKFSRRVRFQINFSITRQILKRNKLPKSTTCTFHIVFLHITMYSYRLQYLHQLDNSILLRSYNTFCTLFCKDFNFCFLYVVPLLSLKLFDTYKNQLPLIVKPQQLIQFEPHTYLSCF